jgi:glucose-6-phosphate isomerase
LAQNKNLSERIQALFTGECVNATEQRPALHTALRAPVGTDQTNTQQSIENALTTMDNWVTRLHNGQWKGYDQQAISDVVHIGIGGSNLGPQMVCEALQPYAFTKLRCHFVASVDALELDTLLQTLNPATTLFLIASKTFSTQESLLTADRAKAWLAANAGDQDISTQFIAMTAQRDNALHYGICAENILPFWDWVGGRYSTWSAIGLPIALQFGMPTFRELLAGAHTMDQHFRTAPLDSNMPVIMALLGYWYGAFFDARALAVLPYDYRLRNFPRYLQQLEMESNGKSTQLNGQPVNHATQPILFGEMGTNGQHSFHQLLFQGTHFIPCDFIATLQSHPEKNDRDVLYSHCLAQSRALMLGKSTAEINHELIEQGYSSEQAAKLAAHKTINGNQPSSTLVLEALNAQNLGALMALYEHKVFVQGVLWDINSFDQWGVELGKAVAKDVLDSMRGKNAAVNYDSSTQGLINYFQNK